MKQMMYKPCSWKDTCEKFLCANFFTLSMNVGENIHHFIDTLKSKIKVQVAMYTLDDVQPWEDFQRLITYVISVDSNFLQVDFRLDIACTKNTEKKFFYKNRWSNQESKEITMKFTNGREMKHKRVATLKKNGNAMFCKEKSHRVNTSPEMSNSIVDKAENNGCVYVG